MAVIQPKKRAVIKKGTNFSYVPETFEEHINPNFLEVSDPQDIIDLVGDAKFFVFDTETYPERIPNHMVPPNVVRRWVGSGKKANPQDFPFCISICVGDTAMSIYDTLDNGFSKFKKLAPLFADETIEKCAHNAKFDMHTLANIGIPIRGKIHDTVVLTKLTNENRNSFKLMDLAASVGGEVKFEYMVDNYKKSAKVSDYRDIPRELINQYANADVYNCWLVFHNEYPKLVEDGLVPLYENELQLMLALWEMERHGMLVDKNYETTLKEHLQQMVDDCEQSIYDEAGELFNINSGAQIHKILLKLGVSPQVFKYTEKGNAKMDKNELARLGEQLNIGLVNKILEYRKYEKLLTTYAVGIYDQADSECKVHGSINQTEATTGRMSITKPALQTLPKKDKSIRKAFIPSEGYELWFMDLDQVEYRLYAHYAKDDGLCQLIKQGHDVHTATAALLYHKDIADVTEDERSRAKTINFALIYGMGADALAGALKMTKAEAYEMKNRYFSALPTAKPFMQQVEGVIHARGYIKNHFGRRRRLTSNECYKAANALIQGCAADYIKHKIVLIYKYLKKNNLKTRMVNVVHDEVIFELHKDEKHIAPVLRWLLSDFKTFRAPITAGVEYGDPSWGAKVENNECGFQELSDEELEELRQFNLYNMGIDIYGKCSN